MALVESQHPLVQLLDPTEHSLVLEHQHLDFESQLLDRLLPGEEQLSGVVELEVEHLILPHLAPSIQDARVSVRFVALQLQLQQFDFVLLPFDLSLVPLTLIVRVLQPPRGLVKPPENLLLLGNLRG